MTDAAELVDEAGLRKVFRDLAERQVEYAVFGGVALGLHGLARATADLDIFLPADRANIERLKAALRDVFRDQSTTTRPTTCAENTLRCAMFRRTVSASTT